MDEFWAKLRWLKWPWWIFIALFFVAQLSSSLQLVVSSDARNKVIMSSTILGMELGYPTGEGRLWWQVATVQPGGAAEEAGLRAGDAVRFDQPARDVRLLSPGQAVDAYVIREEESFQTEIVARAPEPLPDGPIKTSLIVNQIAVLLSLAFALLLVLRGWKNRMALQMAAMFVLMPGFTPALVLPSSWLVPEILIPCFLLANMAMAGLWPIFCFELTGGPSSRRQVYWVGAAIGLLFIAAIRQAMTEAGLVSPVGNPNLLSAAFVIVDQIIGYAIIAANYHRSNPATRNRIKIILGAFVALMVAYSLSNSNLSGFVAEMVVFNSMYLLALVLLTYGLLKQRLFDLGFAVNRTLVYGMAAFTLLCVFGLVEYIAKSMIPVAWPTAGPFISAGLAVILFLMFHRLHHWFEHHIELLFFGSWHRAESALRRFVESAGHFEQVDALCRDFVGEVRRYANVDEAALYLRGDNGGYARHAGQMVGANAIYESDGRGFAMMRTERGPMDLAGAGHPLPGALALPMLNQGNLIGFVLVGRKPDGLQFRPDEVENLGESAQQVGLDLQALRARELRAQLARQQEANASLLKQNERIVAERDRLAAEREGFMGLLKEGRSVNN